MKFGEMFIPQFVLVVLIITQVTCLDRAKYTECAKELKLEPNPETGVIPEDTDISCLLKCMYQKQGSIDENGRIIIEKHHKVLQPYLKTCEEKIKTTDPCKRVHDIDDCLDDDFSSLTKDIKQFCAAETKTEYKDENLLNFEDYSKACFHQCSLEIMEILDENGDISYADLIMKGDYIFKGNIGKVIEDCEKENNQEDLCVRSMKRVNCFLDNFD